MKRDWLGLFLLKTDMLMAGSRFPADRREACLLSLARAFS